MAGGCIARSVAVLASVLTEWACSTFEQQLAPMKQVSQSFSEARLFNSYAQSTVARLLYPVLMFPLSLSCKLRGAELCAI